jgi:hypothetical protein
MPRPEFQSRQLRFTAHIRDPERVPPPADVPERRMAVYRELLYNNVEGFIARSFPVLRRVYEETAWHRLVRGFFARHRCRTPYFLEIPREFLDYLEREHEPGPGDPPFLVELAHYEWVELALSVSEAEADPARFDPRGDLLAGRPVLSPTAWPLAYAWPVHRIGPRFRPAEPPDQPTFLLAWRGPDEAVHFMELNPVTARLLELVEAGREASGRAMLERIAAEISHPDPARVIHAGREALETLREAGAVLGTARG